VSKVIPLQVSDKHSPTLEYLNIKLDYAADFIDSCCMKKFVKTPLPYKARSHILLLLALLLFGGIFFTANASLAQEATNVTTTANSNGTVSQEPAAPATWRAILERVSQALSREGLTDIELDGLLNETSNVENEASVRAQSEEQKLTPFQQRLDALGPAPKEGEAPEPEDLAAQRQRLTDEFSIQSAQIKEAADAALQAQLLREQIAKRRHDKFFTEISNRTSGVLQPAFWLKFTDGFSGFAKSIQLLVSDSLSALQNVLLTDTFKLIILLFFAPLLLLIFFRARNILDRLSSYIPEHTENRALEGFLYYLANGILPSILIVALYKLVETQDLLTTRFDQFAFLFANSMSLVLIINCLARVWLSPNESERRIARISNGMAINGYRILKYGLWAAYITFLINGLAVIFVMPLEVKVGLSFIFSLFVAIPTLTMLWMYRRDRQKQAQLSEYTPIPVFTRYLGIVVWGASLFILIAAIAGYISFSEFLAQQLLFGIAVTLSAWLLLRFIDFLFLQLSISHIENIEGTESNTANFGNAGQIAILGAGVSKLTVYIVAAVLLMLPWGYRTSDFFQIFEKAFFGFEVGGLSISISTVLLALLLFVIGYTITMALRAWLNDKLLPTTSLDIGVSNSISTVFGYIGIVVAAMLAISAAGFDLSNLAIVAGALSLGVGFGLQSIVSNFVSGLILLAERPIKAGDWVSTSGGDGYVRKISVRSTEIETFDRATIIVPNSSLITDTVTNWTHGNKTGRIRIPIGVAYDSDPDQVKEILLTCAAEHKLVLGRPAPVVYFMEFGASSLDFELRCFLSDINYGMSVTSDLRFSILKEFRAADIGIPFPQREVLIKSEEPAPAPKRKRIPAKKA